MQEPHEWPIKQPQLVIGLGTGRCGTQSLAHLLTQQTAALVYHEKAHYGIGWHGSEKKIDELLAWASTQTHLQMVGDVAFYYLPYVEYILARNPTVKFICLQRNCADTVASYLQKTKPWNHWIVHEGGAWQPSEWDDCYPKYSVPDKQSALAMFWYEYYFTATRLQALHPKHFRLFPMAALNSKAGQLSLLAFLGLPEAQMQLAIGIHANAGRNITYWYAQWEKLPRSIRQPVRAFYRWLKPRSTTARLNEDKE